MIKLNIILNVLIACEESQAECAAFRALGHNAFSCDLLGCKKGMHPEWHIKGDVSPYLNGVTCFTTSDGVRHEVNRWHLIIAHPPCTYLCRTSSVQLMKNPDGWRYTIKGWKFLNVARWEKLQIAKSFFIQCLNAKAMYVAVENPIPMAIAELPRPNAYACPSWFGIKYTKKTLYWTRNLPTIMAKQEYSNPTPYIKASRGKYRSRTFPALANAIAEQWSIYILNDLRAAHLRTHKYIVPPPTSGATAPVPPPTNATTQALPPLTPTQQP